MKILYIVLGTIITVLVAYPLSGIAEKLVFRPDLVGLLLVITAFILFLSEIINFTLKNKMTLTIKSKEIKEKRLL